MLYALCFLLCAFCFVPAPLFLLLLLLLLLPPPLVMAAAAAAEGNKVTGQAGHGAVFLQQRCHVAEPQVLGAAHRQEAAALPYVLRPQAQSVHDDRRGVAAPAPVASRRRRRCCCLRMQCRSCVLLRPLAR